jgi:ankyrin repeat protein
MRETDSPILTALYNRQPEAAATLAAGTAHLSLFEAAALGRADVLGRLLARDPSAANAFTVDGHTALGLASFFGRPGCVRILLDHGADPQVASRNEMRVQPLHAAVAGRSREIVELLLARGVDVNARQQVGYTALMGAASAGREDIIDLLIGHGADPAVAADDGLTAAAVARQHGHEGAAAKLERGRVTSAPGEAPRSDQGVTPASGE